MYHFNCGPQSPITGLTITFPLVKGFDLYNAPTLSIGDAVYNPIKSVVKIDKALVEVTYELDGSGDYPFETTITHRLRNA
jgi:hypothetical protein